MTEQDNGQHSERLPASDADRLLVRASEIEAARGTELTVAELREVAREAGIAPSAFDEALAELRNRDVGGPAPNVAVAAPEAKPGLMQLLTRFWPVSVMVGLLLFFFLMRLFPL